MTDQTQSASQFESDPRRWRQPNPPPLDTVGLAELEAAMDAAMISLDLLNGACNEPRVKDKAAKLIDNVILPLDKLASDIFEEARLRKPATCQDAEIRGSILVGYAVRVGMTWQEIAAFAVETLAFRDPSQIH